MADVRFTLKGGAIGKIAKSDEMADYLAGKAGEVIAGADAGRSSDSMRNPLFDAYSIKHATRAVGRASTANPHGYYATMKYHILQGALARIRA